MYGFTSSPLMSSALIDGINAAIQQQRTSVSACITNTARGGDSEAKQGEDKVDLVESLKKYYATICPSPPGGSPARLHPHRPEVDPNSVYILPF